VELHRQRIEHLRRLAEALATHEFATQVVGGDRPYVEVANPDTPQLHERVLCRQADDGSWCYWWPWRQPIGSVDDLAAAVGKITAVLRSVEGRQ
jgi:hypothetical protein